jgi:O-acetyl-ADP-ribose deacetylase (regulator of RNase III)
MIELIQGDITKIKVDAIVNAANSSLLGGGGVDGAIHRIGGPDILAACEKIRLKQGACKTGEAVLTTGGKLPAQYVIHAVGPVWNGGNNNEEALLARTYTSCFKLAIEYEFKSLAFPNISTGRYSFPKQRAAEIAIHSTQNFLQSHNAINKIIFVCYDEENFRIYKALLAD